MQLVFAAGAAKTGAFQLLAVEALEVAIGVVIIVLALRALEANEVILRHGKTLGEIRFFCKLTFFLRLAFECFPHTSKQGRYALLLAF